MTHLPPGAAVRYFMQLTGQPVPEKPDPNVMHNDTWDLRLELIDEERKELIEAWWDKDPAAFLDACVDLVYVVVGAAVAAGMGNHFDEAFTAVHRANMSKAPKCEECAGAGSVHINTRQYELGLTKQMPTTTCPSCGGRGRIVRFRDDGKVLKPIGWVAPNMSDIIWKENDAAGTPHPQP